MDKRESKRMVCGEVASMMIEQVAEGELGLSLPPDDRARFEEGYFELAEELLRRSGVDIPKDPDPIDERQMTVYDFLEKIA